MDIERGVVVFSPFEEGITQSQIQNYFPSDEVYSVTCFQATKES